MGQNADLFRLDTILLLKGIIAVAHKACHNARTAQLVLFGRPQELQPRPEDLEEVLQGISGPSSGHCKLGAGCSLDDRAAVGRLHRQDRQNCLSWVESA